MEANVTEIGPDIFRFSHGKLITPRFGVSSVPDDEAATSEDLFELADAALRAYRPRRGA